MIKIISESAPNSISEAATFLKSGKIIIFATDTIYGLAVDANNYNAVESLYQIKNRNSNKAIAILLQNLQIAEDIFDLNEKTKKLAKKFLPGPLTIIAPLKEKQISLSKNLNNIDNSLGFRIIDRCFINNLLREFNGAIALTSANLSGENPLYKISDIAETFKNSKLDLLIIDSGESKERKASTVIKITDNNLIILREGLIPKDKIFSTHESK